MTYHFYPLPTSTYLHLLPYPNMLPPSFVFDALLCTARAILKFMGVGPPTGAWRLTGDHVLTKE